MKPIWWEFTRIESYYPLTELGTDGKDQERIWLKVIFIIATTCDSDETRQFDPISKFEILTE